MRRLMWPPRLVCGSMAASRNASSRSLARKTKNWVGKGSPGMTCRELERVPPAIPSGGHYRMAADRFLLRFQTALPATRGGHPLSESTANRDAALLDQHDDQQDDQRQRGYALVLERTDVELNVETDAAGADQTEDQ